MGGETALAETWFGNIWKNSRKSMSWEPEKPVLGILAFEVSRLMSKVVNLWHCLTDRQIAKLKEEIANSVGIQKLISEDSNYLIDLALAEIIQTFESVVKSVVVLGKKCTDPTYHKLENVFDNPDEMDPKWFFWRYRLKKMERKVKKMDKFVASTEQLYQELEVLAELEQSLRRMRAGATTGRVKLLEFQQKVSWQRQEVKNLREASPWVRTHDYTVRLLLRSLFTIFERIKYVYATNQTQNSEGNNDAPEGLRFGRNNTISSILDNSVYPAENNHPSKIRLPVERTFSGLGLGNSNKSILKNMRFSGSMRQHQLKARRFTTAGFTGCMTAGSQSPFLESYTPACGSSFRSNPPPSRDTYGYGLKVASPCPPASNDPSAAKVSFFNSKRHLLDSPVSTLGYAAVALHYANIIILIEKLASSPHLISLDARDDLYNLLPATIRSCLRSKLKTFSKNRSLSVYDPAFAAEWNMAITRILEWLSPLAHNMIRWQSERNFERQRLVYGSNVLLVQTLHFANQTQTEAAIVELLMGLNYLFRFGQNVNEKPFRESSCSGAYEGYFCPKGNMYYNMIGHTS